MSTRRLRAVAAGPLPEELADRVRRAEPRLDLIVEQALLPPMRHPGDHQGDPSFRRSKADQRRFEELLDSAEVLYGIPDERPAALTRTVRANPALRWVQTMPAGGGAQVKRAGLTAEELDRIAFTTTAGVHEEPLAEFALFGLLAGLKTLPRLQGHQRRHDWTGDRWTMRMLAGSRVLVVGLGHIGRTTAAKLAALGVQVAGTSRRDVTVDGVVEVLHPDVLADRIGEFDGVVVALPGTAETERLVSAEVLERMKPGTVLVNVGRGTVIDEPALVRALEDGRVGFAALDVVAEEPLASDSPLWDFDTVLLSPHTAALNAREDELIAALFADNAARYLDGRELVNRVDTVEFY